MVCTSFSRSDSESLMVCMASFGSSLMLRDRFGFLNCICDKMYIHPCPASEATACPVQENDEDTFVTHNTLVPGTTDKYLNSNCSFSSRPNDDANILVISSTTLALDHVDTKWILAMRPSSASLRLFFALGMGIVTLSYFTSGCWSKHTMSLAYVFSLPTCTETFRFLEFVFVVDEVECLLPRNDDGS